MNLGRGYVAYRFNPCMVKTPSRFMETDPTFGKFLVNSPGHYDCVNETYGEHHKDLDINRVQREKDYDDYMNRGWTSLYDANRIKGLKMDYKRQMTPWSTSYSEYGRHCRTKPPGRSVGGSTLASPAVDHQLKESEVKQYIQEYNERVSQAQERPEAPAPMQQAPVEDIHLPPLGVNQYLVQQAPIRVPPPMPLEYKHNKHGQLVAMQKEFEEKIEEQKTKSKDSKRRGLVSRGPARLFMEQQCGRLLDNMQAVRGVRPPPAPHDPEVLVIDNENMPLTDGEEEELDL